MRRLVQEHRGVRGQRLRVAGGVATAEECGFLRVEVGMAREVMKMIGKEMGAVPRIDEQ